MSAVVRQALAAAASTVPGVSCSPYFTTSLKAGDAMVRLDRIAYPNKFGGVATWQVLVLLPQDTAAAEKYLEAKVGALIEALGAELTVNTVTPQQLALENGAKVPCVVIEGTRESE